MSTYHQTDCVVLHDAQNKQWNYYSSPVHVLQTNDPAKVKSILSEVSDYVENQNLYAAGFVGYEAGHVFDDSLTVKESDEFPLIWFGLYERFEIIDFPELDQTLRDELNWELTISDENYAVALAKIKEYIRNGDTYQVNYSFRMRADFNDDAWSMFVQMVHAQNLSSGLGYCAYVNTDRWTICSASPELFFEMQAGELISKPMKGTTPRGKGYADDMAASQWLRQSEKNCAENVMIADMVRHDMGKVAKTGTVRASSLLELEKYPTFWTMTTTVTCDTDAGLVDVFDALFPAASITGAPKARAMEIIDELESELRNIYTGCIGFYHPDGQAQFNVAIRTVLIDRLNQQAEYGVGGGIVWDSEAGDELHECHTKAKVLTYIQPTFDLIETLKWDSMNGYALLDEHLKRLEESAYYFSTPFNKAQIVESLELSSSLYSYPEMRVRIVLNKQGDADVESDRLDPLPNPYWVKLAQSPVNSSNYFLYHKTTHRNVYDKAREEQQGCHDVLLWNERNELTESCIANIVVQLDGKLFTPPINSGLLNGLKREELLNANQIFESVITLEDLKRSEKLFLVNSVRGIWEIELVDSPH